MNWKLLTPFLLLGFLVSCGNETRTTSNSAAGFETDSLSLKLKFAETSFVVPSPVQTSILLKKCDAQFNNDLTSPLGSVEKFTTTNKKSLALGIYGADLSYLNLYEQKESGAKYLQNVQSLLNDLEISSSIDKSILKKLEA